MRVHGSISYYITFSHTVCMYGMHMFIDRLPLEWHTSVKSITVLQ